MKNNNIEQYKIISEDLRFYADQRFKILSVYLIVNGFLINYVTEAFNYTIAYVGILLSILCLFWDIKTKLWWGTLIRLAQALEENNDNNLGKLYFYYQKQNEGKGFDKVAVYKPSTIAKIIYLVGVVIWISSILYNCYIKD